MDITLISLVFYLLLVDSFGALWVAFLGQRWYINNVGFASKWFPPAKGWAIVYFVLALLLVLQHHSLV